MWLGSGQRFYLRQANVLLLHARAFLGPVVIMVLLEMGTPSSAVKTWHFSCFLVLTARGRPKLMPVWKLVMLSSRSGWLIAA